MDGTSELWSSKWNNLLKVWWSRTPPHGRLALLSLLCLTELDQSRQLSVSLLPWPGELYRVMLRDAGCRSWSKRLVNGVVDLKLVGWLYGRRKVARTRFKCCDCSWVEMMLQLWCLHSSFLGRMRRDLLQIADWSPSFITCYALPFQLHPRSQLFSPPLSDRVFSCLLQVRKFI